MEDRKSRKKLNSAVFKYYPVDSSFSDKAYIIVRRWIYEEILGCTAADIRNYYDILSHISIHDYLTTEQLQEITLAEDMIYRTIENKNISPTDAAKEVLRSGLITKYPFF